MTADLAFVRPAHHDVSFQALIVDLRIGAGLSQNKAARLAGIDPEYWRRLECGVSQMPSRAVVLAIADAVESTVADRERLLIATGHCPEFLLAMPPERVTALLRLLEVAS